MGRSYSLDLRVRVAGFVEAGHSRRAAARAPARPDSAFPRWATWRSRAANSAKDGEPASARACRPVVVSPR